MKRLVTLILLMATLCLALSGPALAVDRGTANLITYNTARSKAAIGHPWTFLGIHINLVGPQGGTVEWVGHYLLFRQDGDTFMNCSGEVEITESGAVYHATISCVYPPILG